jgi:hypothetical protein
LRDVCTPTLTTDTIVNLLNACPQGMDKENVVCLKKKEVLPFVRTRVSAEDMPSEMGRI